MMEIQFRIKIFHPDKGSGPNSSFADYPFHGSL